MIIQTDRDHACFDFGFNSAITIIVVIIIVIIIVVRRCHKIPIRQIHGKVLADLEIDPGQELPRKSGLVVARRIAGCDARFPGRGCGGDVHIGKADADPHKGMNLPLGIFCDEIEQVTVNIRVTLDGTEIGSR